MTRLEMVLDDLTAAVDWPEPSQHLVTRVMSQIESPMLSRRRPLRWVGAAVVVILIIAVLPATRHAVAGLLHEAGVRIGFVEKTTADLGEELNLGEWMPIEEAARKVAFPLRTPEVLGPPVSVFVEDDAVTMYWDGPVLLGQRSGDGVFAEKGLTSGSNVTSVTLGDVSGLWIAGADHSFTLLDESGKPIEETARLAANVLLWSENGVDHRLELTDGLDRALEIARSLKTD